jgi:hypothetical protein
VPNNQEFSYIAFGFLRELALIFLRYSAKDAPGPDSLPSKAGEQNHPRVTNRSPRQKPSQTLGLLLKVDLLKDAEREIRAPDGIASKRIGEQAPPDARASVRIN